jgi:UDPglucose 6-dehydrogenase
VVIEALTRRGAAIQAYDPVAMPEARRVLADTPNLRFVAHQSEALEGADALLVLTEWKEFRNPDFDLIKSALKQPVILDGRNLYEPALMQAFGIDYVGIGRSAAPAAMPT